MHSLRGVNGALAADLRELSATFDQSVVTGTDEDIGRHGEALCWKWLVAREFMERQQHHLARIFSDLNITDTSPRF